MNIVFFLEIIGTIAFAVSGAMLGIKKHMDILGVIILALTTAVGGGIIRDLMIGVNPPICFRSQSYIICGAVTGVIVFFPPVSRFLSEDHQIYNIILLIMDSLGLGIFTVMGCHSAIIQNPNYGLILLLFVGVITGVGGGILRDLFAQEMPSVFVKHFYATASLLGALLYIIIYPHLSEVLSITIATLFVFSLRIFAYKFKWHLPKA